MARVYIRSITRSTMYQKAPFCVELACEYIYSVACGFAYSDYQKSLISRINEVYVFFSAIFH